jgi:hypothetical protein
MRSDAWRLGIAALALALGACRSSGPLHVVVDPSLADGEVYEVTGFTNRYWGKPLTFGTFATDKTRVGETWAWSGGFFDVGAGKRVQPYRFVFVGEGGERWQVECRAQTPILHLGDADGRWELPLGETRLGCALRDPGETVHPLAVAGSGLEFRGEGRFGDERIEIRGLHEVPGGDGRPHRIPGVLGYELRQGGRVVGSVDLLGHGRVYLARDVAPQLRNPVAMTAAVLLFFGEG